MVDIRSVIIHDGGEWFGLGLWLVLTWTMDDFAGNYGVAVYRKFLLFQNPFWQIFDRKMRGKEILTV